MTETNEMVVSVYGNAIRSATLTMRSRWSSL